MKLIGISCLRNAPRFALFGQASTSLADISATVLLPGSHLLSRCKDQSANSSASSFSACLCAQLTMLVSGREGSPTASSTVEAPKQRYLCRSVCKFMLACPHLRAQVAERILQPHQGASQDSHLRDWPGGGGVSLNRYPVGSCLPSAQKLSLGPAALLRMFCRAVGESRLRNGIASGYVSFIRR